MVRIVFVLLILSLGLSASYKNALSFYNRGLYEKALHEVKHSKKEYSNPNLHLIWGYSANQLGHTEDAMKAFERVLILDSGNKQATKALHKIYRKTGRTNLLDKKEREYVYVLQERGMPERLEKKQTLPIKVSSSLALGYDSNVNVSPGSTILNNYFETNNSQDGITSFFTLLTANMAYEYDFGKGNGWYVKAALDALLKSNFSAHLYDLSALSLELGAGYKQDNYSLYIPVTSSRIRYLDKELLTYYSFRPTLFIPIDDDTMINISLLYSENNYIDTEDQTKDDKILGFSAGGYFLFGEHFAYLSGKYEHRSAQHAQPFKFIGADFFTATIGVHYQMSDLLSAKLNYSFRYGRYDDLVGFSTASRDDNLHLLNVKLSYQLSKMSELYIAYKYTENLSNYILSEYIKNEAFVGVSIKY